MLHRSALHCTSTGTRQKAQQWPLFSSVIYASGHDRSPWCTTTKDRSRKLLRGPWWRLSEASSDLTGLDVERSILRFPRLLHASEGILRILAKGNWKIESSFVGGKFGRSLLCPGWAEKETRGSRPTPRCLPVDRNKLCPDSGRDEKGVWDRTHTHTRTHARTHAIKAPWTARSPALARTWPPARINF